MQKHFYRVAGLGVASDFVLPGAIPVDPGGAAAEVTVSLGQVPALLRDGPALGPNWDMEGDSLLVHVETVARFLVRAGREITVMLDSGATTHDASAHLLGAMFGVLLHQRGTMALHGATVARNGEAIAICGKSGAGKSTLAAALCASGCSLVGDELCAIGLVEGGRPHVQPEGSDHKLWRDAIERLGLHPLQGSPLVHGIQKYFVAAPNSVGQPVPLRSIYVLRDAKQSGETGISPLPLADAMTAIDDESYRAILRLKIAPRLQLLQQNAKVLASVKVFRVTRPRDLSQLDRTADALLAHWDAELR